MKLYFKFNYGTHNLLQAQLQHKSSSSK